MGDRWGDQGPPAEAYSRITRDLTAVSAEFAQYLDALPSQLSAQYLCDVEEATDAELGRLRGDRGGEFDAAFAVLPASPSASSLLVGRNLFQGGDVATLCFGVAVKAWIPSCYCDACDEDSESMSSEARDLIEAVVSGFTEFRRRHATRPGQRLFRGPWLEHGYQWPGGSRAGAGPDVRGELFSRDWAPWQRRSPASP